MIYLKHWGKSLKKKKTLSRCVPSYCKHSSNLDLKFEKTRWHIARGIADISSRLSSFNWIVVAGFLLCKPETLSIPRGKSRVRTPGRPWNIPSTRNEFSYKHFVYDSQRLVRRVASGMVSTRWRHMPHI